MNVYSLYDKSFSGLDLKWQSLMFLVQESQVSRSYAVYKNSGRCFFFCPRQHSVTNPGEWREIFSPPPGIMAEPGGGQWWPFLGHH